MSSKKNIFVFYHANCVDGFSGAWAFWTKFGDKAEYIPVSPKKLPDMEIKNSEVYCVDSSFTKADAKKLIGDGNSVTVVDHHASSEEDVGFATKAVFDVSHSGSVLAWKFLYPGKSIPHFLLNVEDIDLWKLEMDDTKPLISVSSIIERDFKEWDKFVGEIENKKTREEYIKKGNLILLYEKRLIERLLHKVEVVKFEGYEVLAVNSPLFNSDLGHELEKLNPPMGIIWYEDRGDVFVSLRSNDSCDVSKIAGKYGGGGHPRSAGFSFQMSEGFPWERIK